MNTGSTPVHSPVCIRGVSCLILERTLHQPGCIPGVGPSESGYGPKNIHNGRY